MITRINRIRLEFKDLQQAVVVLPNIGINRIRLEFKVQPVHAKSGCIYRINRIRLEFKVYRIAENHGYASYSINRIRLEFKGEIGCETFGLWQLY